MRVLRVVETFNQVIFTNKRQSLDGSAFQTPTNDIFQDKVLSILHIILPSLQARIASYSIITHNEITNFIALSCYLQVVWSSWDLTLTPPPSVQCMIFLNWGC